MSIAKLIITFITLGLMMLGGGYYYFYGMKTVEGNLNINKIKMVNKLYSYDVYSDFYFSIKKQNEDGNSTTVYSELQPLKTEIGYEISKDRAKLTLNSNDNGQKMILSENDSSKYKLEIELMRQFEKVFGQIVAIQDNDYIDKSFNHTKKALDKLYGDDNNISLETVGDFYTEIKNLPIANMRVKYLKLDKIPKNQRGEVKIAPNQKGKWQPNILEWNFGESDKIYLRYFTTGDLKSFLDQKTIVDLIKINENKIQNMFLLIDKNKNTVETYFEDSTGHSYVLTFKASNQGSLKKYMTDYLKIAYGIYFVDMVGFDNWFAKEQSEKTKVSNLYISFISKHIYSEFDQGDLGFFCGGEDEIILEFFDISGDKEKKLYKYKHDEKQLSCSHSDNEDKITWDRTPNTFESKKYKVRSIEEDIAMDEKHTGSLFLTIDDILDIKNGKFVEKPIGSNYFVGFRFVSSETLKNGEKLFSKCVTCHGENAEMMALGASQVIAGWDVEKVEAALNGYKDGSYGGAMRDVMKDQVASLSDQEIKNVASYIATLK
jgi:cytochrome c553